MKKYLSMLAFAAGAFMIASCSGSEADEDTNNDPKVMTFKISSPSASSKTRAAVEDLKLDGHDNTVIWEGNELISVFGNTNYANHKFEYKTSTVSSATFTGPAFESDNYFVLYPYQAGATFDGTTITATIPSVQQATSKSFDPLAAICGGTGSKSATEISLKHACAFLAVTTTAACEYIRIETVDNNWYFSGGVQLNESSGGTPITISGTTGGEKFVQLQADRTETTPTKTFPADTYLIAIASSKNFPKFKIIVKYPGKKPIYATGANATEQFNAGTINNLGEIPVPAS